METKKSITGLSLLISFVMIACLQGYALQAGAQEVVYPTGNPVFDRANVQGAVDTVAAGGTVILKATNVDGSLTPFDFGVPTIWTNPLLSTYDPWRVLITKDVKIIGEKDNEGNPLTKIIGGVWSFYSPLSASYPAPDITIEGIHFDRAIYAPIMIRYASGLKIVGNRITDVHPFPTSSFFQDRIVPSTTYRLRIQLGISVGLLFGVTVPYFPGALTGIIEVSDNMLDLSIDSTVYPPFPSAIGPHTPRNTFGEAIFAGFATGASIVISENYVINCSRNQIEVFDNYLGTDGQGSVLIEGNTVMTPKDGIAYPSKFCPNGIIAGWVLNPPASNDPTKNPKYTISHNYVENKSTRQGTGIFALSDGAVMEKNEVVVTGNSTNPGGANGLPLNIGISIASDNCYGGENRIAGEGQYAMCFFPLNQYQTASNNVCVGNNIEGFNPNEVSAHLYFPQGANNNTVVGGSGTVIDLGTNNTFKGGYWDHLTGSHLTTPGGVGDERSNIKDWWDLP